MQTDNRYTIHQVAALLGISTDAIRLYEKKGLVSPKHDSQNGYRYYTFDNIHQIMGISLYRKLDISIPEIHELIAHNSLDNICRHFDEIIAANEEKIAELQNKTNRMKFMKAHLESLDSICGNFYIKKLPQCFIFHHQDNIELDYNELKNIITSPVFSYGNFAYTLEHNSDESYKSSSLEFLIREPILSLTSLRDIPETLPRHKTCECIYTVVNTDELLNSDWTFNGINKYAQENNIKCGNTGFAFYIYSTMANSVIKDYYEIYIPVI